MMYEEVICGYAFVARKYFKEQGVVPPSTPPAVGFVWVLKEQQTVSNSEETFTVWRWEQRILEAFPASLRDRIR